jgi:two-component system CheB/CheR fusion protein
VAERGRLQRELVDAVWFQQGRFGQELHDSLGQELTGIRMLVESLHRKLRCKSLPEAAIADELREIVHNAQIRVRRLSKGLFPVEIFADGLMAALQDFAESIACHCGIPCRFVCPDPVEVHGNNVATHLFRIAQEAVNNAVKHSAASNIEISLEADGPNIMLQIRDDGIGFTADAGQRPAGVGTRIMRYRANVIGGEMEITSRPREGTTVSCSVGRESLNGNGIG